MQYFSACLPKRFLGPRVYMFHPAGGGVDLFLTLGASPPPPPPPDIDSCIIWQGARKKRKVNITSNSLLCTRKQKAIF